MQRLLLIFNQNQFTIEVNHEYLKEVRLHLNKIYLSRKIKYKVEEEGETRKD